MSDKDPIQPQPGIEFRAEDFQAWKEFSLLIRGFTVVIGPSNQGKSSLFRALRALLRNELNNGYVRTGQKAATLTAVINGKEITMRRTAKGSPTYTILPQNASRPPEDHEKFAKLDGELPKPLEEMNFGRVEVGKVSFDPIFSHQLGRQFLLEESPSDLNTILGAFSSTEKLEEGKREANSRIADCNSLAKVLAVDINASESEVARLEPLVERADVLEADLKRLYAEAELISRVLEVLDVAIPQQKSLDRVKGLLAVLDVPTYDEVDRSHQTLIATQSALGSTQRLYKLHNLLDALHVPEVRTLDTFPSALAAANTALSAQKRLSANSRLGVNIEATLELWPKLIEGYTRVRDIVAVQKLDTQATQLRTSVVSSLSTVLGSVEASGDPNHSLSVLTTITQLEQAQTRLAATREGLASLDDQLAAALKAQQDTVEAQKAELEAARSIQCPECGAVFQEQEKHTHKQAA